MGNSLTAIYDDMNRYRKLCEEYNEVPHYKLDKYNIKTLDCYGEHSTKLEERVKKELDEKYNISPKKIKNMLTSKDISAAILALPKDKRRHVHCLPDEITINGVWYNLKFLEEGEEYLEGHSDIVCQLTDVNGNTTFFMFTTVSNQCENYYTTYWNEISIVAKKEVTTLEWVSLEV